MASLRGWLQHPRVVCRGWVEDLESELQACDVFLVLDNAGPYVVSSTRHLLAWAMGLCLVAHVRSREAFPELEHMRNALLGSTGPQIAELVARAALEPELNQRIRRGGRETYEARFRPVTVVERLVDAMRRVAADERQPQARSMRSARSDDQPAVPTEVAATVAGESG